MRRFVLPASFASIMVLSAGAAGASQSQLALSARFLLPARSVPAADTAEQQQAALDSQDHGSAELQRQVSDLQALVAQVKQQLAQRKARSPGTDVPGQQAAHDASQHNTVDLQQQDAELHNELQSLITQLNQELQFEVQTPPASDPVEQQQRQKARDALKHAIADLQQQDSDLQGLMAQPGQQVAQDEQKPPAPDIGKDQPAQDALQQQATDLQRQIADLRRQDDALQGQLAQHRQELTQSEQELAQRRHDIDTARAEADKLHQEVDSLQQRRQAEEASLTLRRTLQQAIATEPPRPAASKPAPQPTQVQPARQQAASAPAPQPTQPIPTPAAPQQLLTAQQWLSAGRPDEARRLLAVVQTQVVFQPATPDMPDAQGQNDTVTDVGDAIRWLDMGAGDQAMQSIKRAISDANSGTNTAGAIPGNHEGTKQSRPAGR